jgi:hypothetical protein
MPTAGRNPLNRFDERLFPTVYWNGRLLRRFLSRVFESRRQVRLPIWGVG